MVAWVSLEQQEAALRLLESGLSQSRVAAVTGWSYKSIERWSRRAGMRLRPGYHGGLADLDWPMLDEGRHVAGSHANRLDVADRVAIQICLEQGASYAVIARRLGVDPSTISREVRRGRGADGRYIARRAQHRADAARPRPRARRLDADRQLRAVVIEGLNLRFSPRQVAAHVRRVFGGRKDKQVSHETIYQALYVQGRGALRHELSVAKALRSGRTRRIPASKLPPRPGKPWLAGHHISTRPAEAADRAVPGHWEGDLVVGPRSSSAALITLVERSSRFVLLRRLPLRRDSATVVDALIEMASSLPAAIRRSLTWDQGSELAEHARFTLAADTKVYFCDPHSPWQRGSNENTNGLIRDFWPKRTDFTTITDEQISETQHLLNIRPRETLNWATPAEKLNEYITHALTA